MTQHITHRALDGGTVHLSGDLDLSHPYTSIAKIALDGRLHEFTSGEIASGRAWAESLGVTAFPEEFQVQGGRLRLGRTSVKDHQAGVDTPVLAALWEGRSHAVYTHLYHAKASDAVALFDTITVTEHPDGIAITPRRRASFTEPAETVKEVPGVGLLEITRLTKQTANRLPPWRGAKIGARGELFKDTLEDQGTFFLMSTGEALITVLPQDESHVPAVPGRLAKLSTEVKG